MADPRAQDLALAELLAMQREAEWMLSQERRQRARLAYGAEEALGEERKRIRWRDVTPEGLVNAPSWRYSRREAPDWYLAEESERGVLGQRPMDQFQNRLQPHEVELRAELDRRRAEQEYTKQLHPNEVLGRLMQLRSGPPAPEPAPAPQRGVRWVDESGQPVEPPR